MRVAINGFGRIGRAVFRRAIEKGVNVVAVNDLVDTETLAYLLKYDSVYGAWKNKVFPRGVGVRGVGVSGEVGHLEIGKKKILVFNKENPADLPWSDLGVDVVVESTGFFASKEGASKHLLAGAKKVLITASGKDVDYTVVIGVNEKGLKKSHKIISMASCTTNCIAPVVKILDDAFGLKKGFMTTVHAYTGDQKLVDAPHKKLRRARAAGVNLVPTTSGATTATMDVLPKLKGKIDGMAIRAPVACGSICDFVCTLNKSVSADGVNAVMNRAASKLKGVLEYSEEELVSSDVIGNSASSIFDSKLTKVNGNLVKVLSWYDNEWGYSCRVIDLMRML